MGDFPFFAAERPTVVYSDCHSAVTQVVSFLASGVINVQWLCQAWWRSFARLVRTRREVHHDPFKISWIPAHVLESVPDTLLTEEQATAFGTTVFSNEQSMLYTAISSGSQRFMRCCRQQLIALLQSKPQLLYPQWHWHASQHLFSWKPKIPNNIGSAKSWRYGSAAWQAVVEFLRNLKWLCHPEESVSFCELAVAFHADGHRIPGDQAHKTFRDLYKMIREALLFLHKQHNAQPFPGTFNSTKPRAGGRILPQGCIEGAIPFASTKGLTLLAQLFCLGADRRLETWTIPLNEW